ncbi:TetR/AcrR family transcriptional regulator [Brevundimonas sp.]|uniref:TetR/AcrR family transcriptional regulator n=1 Tax=Brevundimonas sp. TaxID=1871086 RepID=UPI00286B7414|nr:TetR/AcrR family transcriptional regulator [Brevundimonas sp.]
MTDKRVDRTRAALEQSFNEIFLVEGYEKSTPAHIAEGARVGRSTFYEHFDGRDDLLEKRLLRVLLPLADVTTSKAGHGDLQPLLDHFWDHRVIVRALLGGRARTVVMRALTRLIEDRIRADQKGSCVPLRMIAAKIAGGHLALLEEWLLGRHRCTSADLARVIAAEVVPRVDPSGRAQDKDHMRRS